MRIAVIGAGAIGSLVAAYLKLKGKEVSLIGTPDSVKAIRQNHLEVSGARGKFKISIDIDIGLRFHPGLVILATKTQDLEKAIRDNFSFLQKAIILTTQNGIQADGIAAQYIPVENIVSSIIMFGATYLESGQVVHNFEGPWIIGKISGGNDEKVIEIVRLLENIFSVIATEEIRGMKYLKVFVNASNCIPAILGMSMQEAFADLDTSRISVAIWKEGLEIVSHAGINLVSLPDFPLERLTRITSLPSAEAAKIFSSIMVNLSKEPLYGSILQSIKRKKTSEIDYINGEFTVLAEKNNLKASLNEKLVEMVHKVETTGKFFSRQELLKETAGLFS